MNMAQTNLSELAKGGPEVAERLDCGGFSAALPRLLAPCRAQSGDESPQSKRCARFVSAGARRANESQRDSGPQPKVARHALPWVNVVQNFSNPNGVAAFGRPTVTQPRRGCRDLWRLTQGSSSLATLGWRTQSRWDWTQTISVNRNGKHFSHRLGGGS